MLATDKLHLKLDKDLVKQEMVNVSTLVKRIGHTYLSRECISLSIVYI